MSLRVRDHGTGTEPCKWMHAGDHLSDASRQSLKHCDTKQKVESAVVEACKSESCRESSRDALLNWIACQIEPHCGGEC